MKQWCALSVFLYSFGLTLKTIFYGESDVIFVDLRVNICIEMMSSFDSIILTSG